MISLFLNWEDDDKMVSKDGTTGQFSGHWGKVVMSLDNQQACLPAWKLFLLVSKVEHIPCCLIQFHLI